MRATGTKSCCGSPRRRWAPHSRPAGHSTRTRTVSIQQLKLCVCSHQPPSCSLFERILFSFWFWAEGGPCADFVFYYNSATEQSTYEHPMDDFYRKVYQRTATRPPDRTALCVRVPEGRAVVAGAKTTAERDPTLLKQGTAAATGGSASALVEATSITPPGRRRSPGNVGGGQPAGILKQVIPPVPSLFTLLRPYLAHFSPVFSHFLRVFTVSTRRFQRAPSRNPGPRNSWQGDQDPRSRPFIRRPRR